MPQYIDVPGHGTVEFPDGMSEDEMGQAIKKNFLVPKPNLTNPNLISNIPYNPTSGMSGTDLALSGAGKYLTDTARGARQLGVDAIASTPGVPFDLLGAKAYSGQLRQEEDERKQQDRPLMQTGAGKAGYVGAGALSSVAGGQLAAPGTLARGILAPSTVMQGALSGGVQSAAMPVGTNDSRAMNVAQGAVLGGGMNAVAQIPSRIAQPMTPSPAAQTLLKEGVVPTPGQAQNRDTMLGGFLGGAEEKMQSIPLIGDIISRARRRSVEDLNAAAIKRAGGEGVGNEAIDAAHRQIGQTFDNLAAGQKVKLDNTFHVDLKDLTLTDDARKTVMGKIKNVFDATKNGELTGEAYQKFRSELSAAGSKYMKSPSPSDHDLGQALSRVANGLDNAFQAQAPAATRAAWAEARDQYANLMRVEAAASKAVGNEGKFSPHQLKNAVAQQGGKSATARGNSRMQDLAEAGMSLQSKTPDSGTASRLMMNALMYGGATAGAGSVLPGAVIPMGAAAAGTAAIYGPRAVTKYAVGGYPAQGILSDILKKPVPAATQAGRLYIQN